MTQDKIWPGHALFLKDMVIGNLDLKKFHLDGNLWSILRCRHCAGSWGYRIENSTVLDLEELTVSQERQSDKQISSMK